MKLTKKKFFFKFQSVNLLIDNMSRLSQNQSNNFFEHLFKSSFITQSVPAQSVPVQSVPVQSVAKNASVDQSQFNSLLNNHNTPSLLSETNSHSTMPEIEVQVNDSTEGLIFSNEPLPRNPVQNKQRNLKFAYKNFLKTLEIKITF